MSSLSLNLLGPIKAYLDGIPVSDLRSSRAQALLIYLAVECHTPQRRESLLTFLWPGMPEKSARHNLNQTSYALRQSFPEVPGREKDEMVPLLVTNRKTIQLNPKAVVNIDIHQLDLLVEEIRCHEHLNLEDCQTCKAALKKAAALYRGDFLADFYLEDSSQYEEWSITLREEYRGKALEVLQTLTDIAIGGSQYDQARKYAERQLKIDNLKESAHRQLMQILARSGRRAEALRQYRSCLQILDRELGVEPSHDTLALYEQIRTESIQPQDPTIPAPNPTQLPAYLPPTDYSPLLEVEEQVLFVGREAELSRLNEILNRSLSSLGQVVFITGEPGQGKTMLTETFARKAMKDIPNLIVVQGKCNAFSGQSDPYLPFREVLSQLTGDVTGGYAPPPLSGEQAIRLLESAAQAMQLLVDHGPHLVDSFVSGGALLDRLQTLKYGESDWFDEIQAFINRPRRSSSDLPQSALLEQYTNVLRAIAAIHPIVLLLDDLQWADKGSLHLLVHLVKRLSGDQFFLLGAFRPEEVALRQDGKRHLLLPILNDFKRRIGDVTIDLQDTDNQTRQDFVNALLDSEPNQLGIDFREQLFARTQGHPLFTVELLQAMQSRGDLVRHPEFGWEKGQQLDWDHLPVRVEAVISDRVERLDDQLREILMVGSVEGETFSGQVIARVEGLPERDLFKTLTQELIGRHRLVREIGEVEVSGHYLTRYRFSHALFQEYFYKGLGSGERRLLHREVATALEDIYQDQVNDISSRLAWHYHEGRIHQKAVKYSLMAGERAIQLSGYEEAISLIFRGLSSLGNLLVSPQNNRQKLKLYLTLGEAQYLAGKITESLEAYLLAADIAKAIESPEDYALAALGYENSRWRFNLPIETTLILLNGALEMLGKEDSVLRVRVWTSLVRARRIIDSQDQFSMMTQQAVEMGRRVNDPLTLYEALLLSLWGDRRPEQSKDRMAALNEMFDLAQTMGDFHRLQDVYGYRWFGYAERGNIRAWKADLDQFDKLVKKVQQPFYIWCNHIAKALMLILEGQFDEAEERVLTAFNYGHQYSIESVDGAYGVQMFTIRREQGRIQELAPMVELFVKQQSARMTWQPGLALLYSELDFRNKATKILNNLARNDFSEIPKDSMWLTSITYLSEVCAYLGDQDRASILYDLLKPHDGMAFLTGMSAICFGAVSRFLGLLASTMSLWEVAEVHFQDAIEMNSKIEAKPWLAHTQHLYAVLLLSGAHSKDREKAFFLLGEALGTAQTLKMVSLENKVKTIMNSEEQKGDINAGLLN